MKAPSSKSASQAQFISRLIVTEIKSLCLLFFLNLSQLVLIFPRTPGEKRVSGSCFSSVMEFFFLFQTSGLLLGKITVQEV